MPDRFVLQILRKLVNDGVIVGVRGVQGGYKLAKPSNKITLLDIIESVDGPLDQRSAFELPGISVKSLTTVRNAISGVVEDARKRLASITQTLKRRFRRSFDALLGQ